MEFQTKLLLNNTEKANKKNRMFESSGKFCVEQKLK